MLDKFDAFSRIREYNNGMEKEKMLFIPPELNATG